MIYFSSGAKYLNQNQQIQVSKKHLKKRIARRNNWFQTNVMPAYLLSTLDPDPVFLSRAGSDDFFVLGVLKNSPSRGHLNARIFQFFPPFLKSKDLKYQATSGSGSKDLIYNDTRGSESKA